MLLLALALLQGLYHTHGSSLNLHLNSAEDPLAAGQACGASGYVLDAPIPGTGQSKSRQRRAATTQEFRVWPQGKIPYVIDKKFSKTGRRLIRQAMKHWENETCISFVKRKTEADYIYIYRGTGCCSYVGRRGGKQFLSLGIGCLRFGIITHELGHVVGFWHEQNRPDRSIYIDVIYDNVDSSKTLNFDPREMTEVDTFDQVYDYESIMHYGTRFFTKNGGNTIQTKTLGAHSSFFRTPGDPITNEIGKSYYKEKGPVLSRQDILETNLLYKCSKISECGGTLFASSGSFTSINFPKEYPLDKKQECIWIITTTKNKKYGDTHSSLTLLFNKFNVGNGRSEKTGYCEDDYVEVREGQGYLSPFMVRYCGNISPSPISTMSGSLYIRFHISGKHANKAAQAFTGFDASFKTDVCSHVVKDFPSTIQTPNFPFTYETEKDCMWVIEAFNGMQVELDFPFFSLRELDSKEGCLDYIEIHEGDGNKERFIGRYCGTNNPGKILSSLKKIKIHFHAAKRKQLGFYMGFKANIKQKDINECALGQHECSQACLNYPGGYFCGCYRGYNTVNQRHSSKAACVDKDECSVNNGGCSHICINTDGSYTCACSDGYTLTANKTSCVDVNECAFQRKPCSHICKNTDGGFQCSCHEGFILKSDNRTCTALPNCKQTFTSPVGVINSPRIPVTYKHDVHCTWNVIIPDHLKLVLTLDLPWGLNSDCQNYLLIHDDPRKRKQRIDSRKVCTQLDAANDIGMIKNTAVIDYYGQIPFLPAFTIQYHSTKQVEVNCGKKVNSTHGRIFSPGYPFQYPSAEDCEWQIHSPNRRKLKVKFAHFGLEFHRYCEFDFIEIEEIYYNQMAIKKIGKFCGDTKPPKIIIDGQLSYLKIIFHSDETMNDKGFKLNFKELS